MIGKRDVIGAMVTGLLMLCIPALLWGQTSVLPLQPGQNVDEEVAKALATIQSDAPLQDKAVACKRLGVIGTKDAVPVLANLLDDEKMGLYARTGLETIPDPSAVAALRDAMGTLTGRLQIGVINSLGNRRDTEAIDALDALLSGEDAEVAKAAAGSLGRIGNAKTAKILADALAGTPESVRPAVGDAALVCAELLLKADKSKEAIKLFDAVRNAELPKHIALAGVRGAILSRGADGVAALAENLQHDDLAFCGIALRAARELNEPAVVAALLKQLDNTSDERKSLILIALGDLGDSTALPAVINAAKAEPKVVRLAAVGAMSQIGDATLVPLLIEAASGDDAEVAAAALDTLKVLPGKETDRSIAGLIGSQDRATKLIVLDLVGHRRIQSAISSLFAAADGPDEEVRLAAIGALGETIGSDDLDTLTGRLIKPKSDEAAKAVQAALKAASIRMSDPDECADELVKSLDKAPLETKIFLMELLNSVGGETATDAVVTIARDNDARLQDEATRVLGSWMNPNAAPALLDLAETLKDQRLKIRMLRGYIRFIRQFGLPDDQKLSMCDKAMDAADRDAERQLVLVALGRIQSPAALAKAVDKLGDAALKQEAAKSALAIADKILQAHPQAVAEAMQKVLDANPGDEDALQAKRLLQRAKRN